ncbi:MAG: hypothetical protein JRF28_08075 [Deltaproteobacteria bacterium]|nr:hypothetical protein [Deltaproteobacteria bacterium]
MLNYVRHIYEQMIGGVISRWEVIYPFVLRTVAVFLVAAFLWVLFKRVLKRVRKRVQKYEFPPGNDTTDHLLINMSHVIQHFTISSLLD